MWYEKTPDKIMALILHARYLGKCLVLNARLTGEPAGITISFLFFPVGLRPEMVNGFSRLDDHAKGFKGLSRQPSGLY